MLRVIGALLTILACGFAGIIMARSYTMRPKYLQDFATALQLLATEIDYGRTSLPEACHKISGQTIPPIAQFFGDFASLLDNDSSLNASEAWNKALAHLSDGGFIKNDVEIIAQLGNVIGRSDANDQLKHILIVQKQLQSCGEQAMGERDKNVRLWNYLGFCVGSLVVLLLI